MADASASGGAGQVPTQRGERERSPTRAPMTQEQQQPTQGPQRFRMNSPEGGQGLPGGTTAPYASVPPPPPKAASGCGSMPRSPTGQQEVFSTAQMTQIAQILSLSLNQAMAMGEFNMRLNGLQQQVVHQQNVFAEAQVQQAASQPAQVPVAKGTPSISSSLSSFGDRPPTSPQPNFPRNNVEQPPGLQQSPRRLISEVRPGQGTAQHTQGEASSQDDRDVFTKSEKWLPPLHKCEHGTWKTREQEILGFAGYVQSLRSWVALASDTFGWELESALSWPHELHMTNLKPAQQLRSARLLAILTQAFAEYPRAHMILQAYSEGIGMDGSFQAVRGTSGFEALRLLAKEFSLRSRAEAAFFRSEFMSKTFKAQSGPTQISDLVRQMDVGLSKYRKLIDTLPQHCDKTGLDLQQVDLTVMLLRDLYLVMWRTMSFCMLQAKVTLIIAQQLWSLNSNNVYFRSLVLMGHQDMCMPWKEMVAGKVTTATKRSRIIMPMVLKRSGNGIQRVSCGSTLPQSTKIQEWNVESVARLDTCRRIAPRIWVVWSASSADRAGILARIARPAVRSLQVHLRLRALGKVQVQPRPSLQRKLDEEKVVAKERCMKFQPKDLKKKSKNLEKRLWCRSFHHRFQVQRELGGC